MLVFVFPILFTTSMPLVTLPNTGCCDGVWPSNQSRNELCTVLTKNCDAAVGLAGVGHGEGSREVRGLIDEFVGDVAAGVALDGLPLALEGRASLGTAGSGARGLGIRRVGAAELEHEPVDDPVEVKAIVKAGVGEIDEVTGGDGHLVHEDLGLEGAHRGVEDGDRVGRCLRGERPDCGALDESRPVLHRAAGEGGARGAQAGGADGSGDGGGGGNHLGCSGCRYVHARGRED